MDFSKLNLGFAKVVLCISRALPNITKPKFGQDFKACWKASVLKWRCWFNQSTQFPMSAVPFWQCFYCIWKKWNQSISETNTQVSEFNCMNWRSCLLANSVYLGFRTCWSSEDWPTVTKGISDIGLRKEQALEKEIKNDAPNMEKGTRTHT